MSYYGWAIFGAIVVIMMILDLGVFHRKTHIVKFKEALIWSCVWVGLALLFNAGIYFFRGSEDALSFLTCYIIEESLSIDNIFIFIMIFSYFKVQDIYQHRVLFWGILGAIIMRAIFIFAGIALIQKFHFMIYVFGGFLIITGIKMLLQGDEEVSPDKNIFVRIVRKIFPITDSYHWHSFFIMQNNKMVATPLFLVLVIIEGFDLIFAVDSIPAVLSVVQDPFIVYTSNIFAILGLRSLYFCFSHVMNRFQYLKVGLSIILTFVGAKMVISDLYKMSTLLSLLIIISVLTLSVLFSLRSEKNKK